MSDVDPFDDFEEEAPQQGRRRWLWACGCGCLAGVAALVALIAMLGLAVQRATDPDRTWALLAESFPHDDWARDSGEYPYILEFGAAIPFTDLKSFTFTRSWSYIDERERGAGSRVGYLFVGDAAGETFAEAAGPSRTLRVQGRDLELRVREWDLETLPAALTPSHAGEESRAALMALLSEQDAEPAIAVLVVPDGAEPPSDAELVEFLAPFHVGPER